MAQLQTSVALVCSIGCVRGNNEDNFYCQGDYMSLQKMDAGAHIVQQLTDARQLFAVMDGMGGENAGERASFLAARTMAERAGSISKGNVITALENYAQCANTVILKDGKANGVAPGKQGTTLAVLCMIGQKAYVSNVGDSRVYLLRSNRLQLLSTDHSPVFAMMKAGMLTPEQARKHPKVNVIERYLGMPQGELSIPHVTTTDLQLCRKDRFMLCSDGISDLLPEVLIAHVLDRASSCDEAAMQLVSTALELGGKDNTTCIVVDVTDRSLPAAPPMPRTIVDDSTTL